MNSYSTFIDTFSLFRTVFEWYDIKNFRVWSWLLIFIGHPRWKIFSFFESIYMISYLSFIDFFSLFHTVFEIFDNKVFRVWPWLLTFRDHPISKIFPTSESPYMTSYLTSIDTFSLFCTVFEIFDVKVFRVWPWPLTFRDYLRSKIFSPFKGPYMTSYLTSIDIFSLFCTVLEIFDIKVFRVWPWPLTFRGHPRSKIFPQFESPYMTFYSTFIDTFSLFRTVFEIYDIKVFRVWPRPLTFVGHPISKTFPPFESPYMISYVSFIDFFSLFRTVFEIFDIKVFRVWPWPLTFRDHPISTIFPPFESPYMTSYLTFIDTFSLFRTVFEIFDINVFRIWPWPLTFRGHARSKIFPPFESPYTITFLSFVDFFSPFRTVFEIFDIKVFRVWPWPLTFWSHPKSKIFPLFESPYMTFYLTSIDTFYVFRTVFEIFDFNVFRVWPRPLTFRDHLRSKNFPSFGGPYMTSYLTSIDIFSLFCTVFEMFDIKVFRVWPWPLTFRSHSRSKIFSLFESPYMTFHSTFIDTFFLFRTVFEIYDIKIFRVWPWPSTFIGHPRPKIFPPFESPYMTSYSLSIDTFYLFSAVFEIFDINLFRVWPWPLTFRDHLRSKIFPIIESPYMTPFLTSIDTSSLFCTVFEIFDIKVCRVWPWPLTFRVHPRSKVFSLFESPYITFYLTFIETFSLFRTVFEIYDIKVFRVWPWPLTLRGHPRSKIFSLFDSPFMTSYLTSIDTFYLFRNVFEIFDINVFRVWPWLLTFRDHPRWKIFPPSGSPYMTSY